MSLTCVLLKERKFRLGRPASEASPASLIRVCETSRLSRLRNPATGASPASLIGVCFRPMDWSVVRPFRGSKALDPGVVEVQLHQTQAAEMDEARAGDRAVCDPQVFEIRQCRKGGQPGVGDPPARHTEERERVQAREVDEVGVGKVEPPEIQVVEPAHPAQARKARPLDFHRAEIQVLKSAQASEMSQAGIGQLALTVKLEGEQAAELPHLGHRRIIDVLSQWVAPRYANRWRRKNRLRSRSRSNRCRGGRRAISSRTGRRALRRN